MRSIKIRGMSDMHLHLRELPELKDYIKHSAAICNRVICMPNTNPPLLTGAAATTYALRAWEYAPEMEVYATIKLTEQTTPETIVRAKQESCVLAVKLYPDGVTNNSHGGISKRLLLEPSPQLREVYETMQDCGLPLSIHGVMPGSFWLAGAHDFLPVLRRLSGDYPRLKIVLEHISTEDGVELVRELHGGGYNVAGTITLHHMVITSHEVRGNIHHYCEPHPECPNDRMALLRAATGGEECFFFGSDSAPHPTTKKYRPGACPGVYSAPTLAMLAEVFNDAGALDKLQDFTSTFGDRFYGLKPTNRVITLVQKSWQVPELIDGVVPFKAGEWVHWALETKS